MDRQITLKGLEKLDFGRKGRANETSVWDLRNALNVRWCLSHNERAHARAQHPPSLDIDPIMQSAELRVETFGNQRDSVLHTLG